MLLDCGKAWDGGSREGIGHRAYPCHLRPLVETVDSVLTTSGPTAVRMLWIPHNRRSGPTLAMWKPEVDGRVGPANGRYGRTSLGHSSPRDDEHTFDRAGKGKQVGQGDELRRRGGLTPEQQAEKFSTGGLDFEDSLRRVLADGPEPEGEDQVDEEAAETERRMTPQELQELLEREQERMRDPEYRRSLIPPPAFVERALRQQENR